ncbi:MAG: hypothetical protein JSU69_01825, partial [Candidatus Zixiibacteriota bacterium]
MTERKPDDYKTRLLFVRKTAPLGLALVLIWLLMGLTSAFASDTTEVKPMALPLNVLEDEGSFTFYVNEEVLVQGQFVWQADGSFASDYTLSMAGQSVATSMKISVDENGFWDLISMETAVGPVEAVRKGDTVEITARGETNSVALRPGTVLFENFSPALMSQAVLAYNREQGGKQTFPLFIVPAVVMDGSLEMLEA